MRLVGFVERCLKHRDPPAELACQEIGQVGRLVNQVVSCLAGVQKVFQHDQLH